MSHTVEAVVIGAGVVGLAVARRLAQTGTQVLILEQAATFGTGTSSRNSEVVHGGLYYHPTSQPHKARWCVRGRHLLYEYCRERPSIACPRVGKLVVATCSVDANAKSNAQQQQLKALEQQCHANGYHQVRILSSKSVQDLEPQVHAPGGALWSPETGLVDSHSFMLHLLGDAQEHGAMVAYQSPVSDANTIIGNKNAHDHHHNSDQLQVQVGTDWIATSLVVNCAGLFASQVAEKFHSSTKNSSNSSSKWVPPKQYFAKGNYFRLQGTPCPFSHLIYPLPDETRGGLGVHATLDWSSSNSQQLGRQQRQRQQQVKFGPNVEWLDPDTRPEQIDYQPNEDQLADFYASIRSYWPDLPDHSLVADYVGVRPKLWHPQAFPHGERDFVVAGPPQHGVAGLYHCLGIESPGLTSSLALAEDLVDRIQHER